MGLLKLKRRSIPVFLGLGILLLSLWLLLTENVNVRPILERIEYLVYDLRLAAGLPFEKKTPPSIVIVDVDEKSLGKEGRWPWSRRKVRQLVEKLFEYKATIVGFDVLFSEPERNAVDVLMDALPNDVSLPSFLWDTLKPLTSHFDVDQQFGTFLADKEVVLGFLLHREAATNAGSPPFSYVLKPEVDLPTIPTLPAYTGNLDKIQNVKTSGGFLTNFRDRDGAIRRSLLLLRHQDILYPALSLEMARRYLLLQKIEVKTVKEGNRFIPEGLKLGSLFIPTDAVSQVLVPFRGGPKTFTTISATDVLSNKADPTLLEGSIVLIGASALGLGDLLATPVSPVYPGVEVHASILAGILGQSFHSEPSWSLGAELVLIFLLGLILVLVFPRLGPFAILLAWAGVSSLLVLLNYWCWVVLRLALNLSLPLISVSLIFTVNLTYGFFVEHRRRRELKAMFGQYVPPPHIEEMANEDNPRFGFEGEAREMSVLFADIRDFTTLAEPLSATELKKLLNEFLTPMTEVIFKHNGTIDKYVGDMIMAFWGAPISDLEHPKHAVKAALEMIEVTRSISACFQAKNLPSIQIGVGINTGIMNVGDMGSTFRRCYTVLGDSVNLASRLEGLTKHYGVPILIGELTAEQLNTFFLMKIDKVRVKGKHEPITIYHPLGLIDSISEDQKTEAILFATALNHYLLGDWRDATEAFLGLQGRFGTRTLFSLYLKRISHLSEEPPKHWDGVYTMLEK